MCVKGEGGDLGGRNVDREGVRGPFAVFDVIEAVAQLQKQNAYLDRQDRLLLPPAIYNPDPATT